MKRILLVLSVLICLSTGLYSAKHSAEFPLGTYTNIRNSFPFFYQNREEISRNLQTLGYNSTLIETDSRENDLPTLFDILDRYGIDALIYDRSWSNDPNNLMHYAIGALSTNVSNRFEAEFSSEADVKPGDSKKSQYWYASRDEAHLCRLGRAIPDTSASYGYAWLLRRGEGEGYAYTDLKYRWINKWGGYSRASKLWDVFKTNPPGYENQYFYVRYRIKIDNLDQNLALSDTLLSFSAQGLRLEGTGFSRNMTPIGHRSSISNGSIVRQTDLTLRDLKAAGPEAQYITVELKLAYAELIQAGILTDDFDNNPATDPSGTTLRLINLNPRLWSRGRCDLYLDWIEIENQIHYDMRTMNNTYRNGVIRRWEQLRNQSRGNIAGMYSHDEPFQGMFETYKTVENLFNGIDVEFFTANYDYLNQQMVIDAKQKKYYNHLEAFRDIAEPSIMATDIYPVIPEMNWNGRGDSEDLPFIQDLYEFKVDRSYRMAKTYSLEAEGRKFYPIVQTFGRWANIGGRDQWTGWVQAPVATQKVLNYLPLCYGADGVYHYRFQSFQTRAGYGDHSVMTSYSDRGQYEPVVVDSITWRAVAESNPRVKLYGTMIRGMRWQDTRVLKTGSNRANTYERAIGISNIHLPSETNAPYSGYIQVANYRNLDGLDYLFVLNRRGNYFRASSQYEEAKFVAPQEYERCFPEANPQQLNIRLSRSAARLTGKYPAMYDPFDGTMQVGSGRNVVIDLPAGEGRLYKLVGTMPERFRGSNQIDGEAMITGDCVMSRKSKLTIGQNARLILMPGAVLRFESKAKLILDGTIVLMEGARIESGDSIIRRGNGRIVSPEHWSIQANAR